jgi:hypothetical protein
MSELAPEQVDIQPAETVAQGQNQLTATQVVDARALRCRRDGHAVALLHSWGRPKPWEPSARTHLRRSAYLRCLRRLSVGGDVAVRVPDAWLVPWLRGGASGRVSVWWLTQARRPWRGTRERAKGLAGELAARLRR